MAKAIEKVLIANRGEIARRIQRTCRRLGIRTVAVYSEADAALPYVREADEAVAIGPAPSQESYLAIDRVVEAARKTNADAVHPGYGFLSENADFAEAVVAAGLRFVGPTAASIRAMGLKREAKALVSELGVPVVAGYDGNDQEPATLEREASRIGRPVLIKASAGGGGKGMRIVREGQDLSSALSDARKEAEAAFGDGTLILERYLTQARHIEVQVLGDVDGNVIHLFERECSIQRRHQKVVEESPASGLTPELRTALTAAAVRVARAIGYVGAGTVEFIVVRDEFFFLEMNTRLQVEHPVTELVTGVDLVAAQLRIAEGQPLPWSQSELELRGAAIEARLYAEDPGQGFLPSPGPLVVYRPPSLDGVRVDDGYEEGLEVSTHYDPMVAKVVAHGSNRQEASRLLARALEGFAVAGVETNRSLLIEVLKHPAWAEGALHTGFLAEHTLRGAPSSTHIGFAAIVATLAAVGDRASAMPAPKAPAGFRLDWRFQRPPQSHAVYRASQEDVEVRYRVVPGAVVALVGCVRVGAEEPRDFEARLVERLDGAIRVEVGGVCRRVALVGGEEWVVADGVALWSPPRLAPPGEERPPGAAVAPTPGRVVQVSCEVGQRVEAGAPLIGLEAMKMVHQIEAAQTGVVEQVLVAEGQQVEAEELLVVISPSSEP